MFQTLLFSKPVYFFLVLYRQKMCKYLTNKILIEQNFEIIQQQQRKCNFHTRNFKFRKILLHVIWNFIEMLLLFFIFKKNDKTQKILLREISNFIEAGFPIFFAHNHFRFKIFFKYTFLGILKTWNYIIFGTTLSSNLKLFAWKICFQFFPTLSETIVRNVHNFLCACHSDLLLRENFNTIPFNHNVVPCLRQREWRLPRPWWWIGNSSRSRQW